MGKFKSIDAENRAKYPELYNGHANEEFWIQCRKEELLEKESKSLIIIRKGKKCQKKRKK